MCYNLNIQFPTLGGTIMKKTFLTVALLLSLSLLTACGDTDETGITIDSSSASSETITTSETTVSTDMTANETTTEEFTTTSATTLTESESEPDGENSDIAKEDTSETTTEMHGTSSADFVTITGDWYIDGDTSLAHIHIEPDGTFQTYYASGNLESEGKIRYESEEIDGKVVNWYNLYNNDNEFIMGFIDDGSEYKTDIYIGNGAYPHYTKLSFPGGLDDDGRGSDE